MGRLRTLRYRRALKVADGFGDALSPQGPANDR
jgi:hypothetical protein